MGHFTSMMTIKAPDIFQDDRVPLKKRSSRKTQDTPEDTNGSALSRDEKRCEARRKSNRLSARRARICIKTTIKELQDSNKQLLATNAALSRQLEEMLHLNSEMRHLMEGQVNKALEENRLLQLMLECRIAAERSCPRRITSSKESMTFPLPLTRLPRAPSNESPGSPKSTSLPTDVIEREGGMPASNTIYVKIRRLEQEIKELKDTLS